MTLPHERAADDGKATRETVFITGASSGIGRQAAIDLSESYSLILNGRDAARLEETLSLCKPGAYLMWARDLSNVETLQADFAEWQNASGARINHFVHCAGVVRVMASRMIDMAHIKLIFDVNFNAAMLLTAMLLKKKARARLKSIVYISALYSKVGMPAHAVYSASKGALDSAMRSLAVELAPRVRVNSIAPGAVDTPMAKGLLKDSEERARLLSQYPLGIGAPSDVSQLVAFLISEKARWITGQRIVIDGGRSINAAL